MFKSRKAFKCDTCDKSFSHPNNLKKHIGYTHEVPKVYHHCPIENCDFLTARRNLIDKHLKSHKKCESCGKIFSGSRGPSQFRAHMRKHEKENGYICNFCHRQFKFKCYLESHRKTCGKPEKELKDFDMKDLRLLVQHAKTKFNF